MCLLGNLLSSSIVFLWKKLIYREGLTWCSFNPFPLPFGYRGLDGLLRRAIDFGLFLGFKMGTSDLAISHLLYVNDTLIFGDATIDNMWGVKSIVLRFWGRIGPQVNNLNKILIRTNCILIFFVKMEGFCTANKKLFHLNTQVSWLNLIQRTRFIRNPWLTLSIKYSSLGVTST